MKSGLLILNLVLLVLVGVLFYLHFSKPAVAGVRKEANPKGVVASAQPSAGEEFRIAYFDMDSVQESFVLVKEVKNELSRKEANIASELSRLDKAFRDKYAQFQSQAQNQAMTQVESETAQRTMMQMEQDMRTRKQALDQEYQDHYMRRMRELKTKIEEYLKDYNATKRYTYIFAYEPGLIYYRDTTYNITHDVIKGLNEQYSAKKK
ncbi:MAG TPA: OmpH family outer membrane protein [Chitinophagaceae bacterium]|jgi:outer membrane protein|nr:OmpH family outer membrane protein [Chitinophagaceae bacterium]